MKVSQSRYGIITLDAMTLIRQHHTPVESWNTAVTGKEKGCPKSAFLGLCQFGWVQGVQRGAYLSSRALTGPNKDYAIRAAQLVLIHPEVIYTPTELWQLIIQEFDQPPANHNQQMNVVLALKEHGLLIQGVIP